MTGRVALRLGECDLHVWVIPLDDRAKQRRRELSHLAQARLLAGYLGVTPAMLETERGPGGKPRLRGEPLHFNLSHSGRLALLAVSRHREVGVDVQAPHPTTARPWFARRICTDREYEHYGRAPSEQELLRLWVRKEAVIKARGEGSYVTAGEIDVLDDEVAGGYICRDLVLPHASDHRAAVAVAMAGGEGRGPGPVGERAQRDPAPEPVLLDFAFQPAA